MTPDAPFDVESWRAEIPALGRVVPLANCSHAPLLDGVRAGLRRFADSWSERVMDWDAWMDEVDAARAAFARLIGAAADEIATLTSVTQAASVVASALDDDLSRPDVLISEAEFPTIPHVWLARERLGSQRVVRAGTEKLAGRIDRRTRLVCAAHGWYRNGLLLDLSSISRAAHQHGALVFTDAYQTVGVRAVSVRELGVDFLAAGCHKFLLGAPGIAFLWVRPELIERLTPSISGWFGRREILAFDSEALDWAEDARRFEQATPPVPAAYAARAGLDVIEKIGIDTIERATGALSRRLVAGGLERGLEVFGTTDPERKTPLTAFRCTGDEEQVGRKMLDRGFLVAPRQGTIRIAPHFFNTPAEVDAALDALAELT